MASMTLPLRNSPGDVDIFARTTPEHKLRLVTTLQNQGAIVAMTGDGVNDAPALKRANIGIAMGRKGTEAAQEAAQMVIADDNFATIVNAVKTGRTIDDNIKKSVIFLLPTSIAEALMIALAILLGYQLPITPLQILWVNMITAVTLGLALAFRTTPGRRHAAAATAGERADAFRFRHLAMLLCQPADPHRRYGTARHGAKWRRLAGLRPHHRGGRAGLVRGRLPHFVPTTHPVRR